MKVLVACEESQRVCTAFREKGHEAYSCDIIDCSGGHPEWHIKQDVLSILNPHRISNSFYGIVFRTEDGEAHRIEGKWDLIIAHPPCTYLTSAGTRHFSLKCNSAEKVVEREKKREEAYNFVLKIANADCKKICIENPVGYLNTHWKKPDQTIHPYFFAANENDKENYVQKRTCLWLKGLNKLQKINSLDKPKPLYFCQGDKCKGKAIGWVEGLSGISGGQKERAKARSKTFPGIAEAMAEQWGNHPAEKGGKQE